MNMLKEINVDELLASYDRRIEKAICKRLQTKKKCLRCGKQFTPEHSGNKLCEKCGIYAKSADVDGFTVY